LIGVEFLNVPAVVANAIDHEDPSVTPGNA
jgi:hypothetical protein